MECLRDYISIKGCGLPAPDSGLYLNTLPGIEFANIDEIANADQVSYAGVWNDIQTRAINRFRLDVLGRISGFGKRYKLRQLTQTVDLQRELTGNTTPASNNKSGIVIELNAPGDQVVCSNMQTIYVQSISFYMVANGNYTIIVKDADSGDILDTFTKVGATAGWNIIKSDKQYTGRRISITVDTTALTTGILDLSQFNLQGFGQANWSSQDWGWNSNGLWSSWACTGTAQVRGVQYDANYANPVYGSNTFGISAVYSLKCSYDNVVCNNKRHFANAFMYVLGSELMSERIYTSRINRWTTVDLKTAVNLRREFEVNYRGGVLKDQYSVEGELDKAIASIDIDLSDCCIEADAAIQWRETQL